jgi:hypothetical protein
MKIVICIRHLTCICRKSSRGVDYSWHVQHYFANLVWASMHRFARYSDVEQMKLSSSTETAKQHTRDVEVIRCLT